ncbi:uncharacterized protein LOC123697457 [Colias croceus]|uniref:uncharacterized protein LOC123697457 n=1 Tax=Colias crocea TaxID=72248 RepID=UPI001E27E024|nr:uncharacterized protein LOC123697457 [Colias croceus]
MISLIVYEIMWITLKFLHVWAVLATMFSICCKKPRLLQVAFYIILPNWMLDILNMVSSKFFLNPIFQVIFLVDICYDGYNLMAINSLYKQMSRKSRIVPGDDLNNQDNSPETPTTTVTPFAETTLYQCVTCYNSVPLEHRSDVVNIPQVNIPIETPEDTNNDAADNTQENNEEKILNFKDGPIIFNQEQLEGEHS